jgi:hypothetical protein
LFEVILGQVLARFYVFRGENRGERRLRSGIGESLLNYILIIYLPNPKSILKSIV